MARVLLIEDDAGTAALGRRGLGEAGHDVEHAADGAEGLKLLRDGGFDIVILDALIPGQDGWEVLGEIRRAGDEIAVLMLSALDSVEHRVKGLALGADDYLTKPFSFDELGLRVEAICRRLERSGKVELTVADLTLDEQAQSATRDGVLIALSTKEFELLRLLVAHRGVVLSRQYIAKHVWDMALDSESNVVEVNIRRLRQKIDDPFARKLIHTIRGRGYVVR